MKKILAAALMSATALSSANAAESGSNFAGAYAGMNTGLVFSKAKYKGNDSVNASQNKNNTTMPIGFQVGYMHNFDNILVGAELGLDFFMFNKKDKVDTNTNNFSYESKKKFAIELTPKAGFAVNDTTAVYGLLGFNFTQHDSKINGTFATNHSKSQGTDCLFSVAPGIGAKFLIDDAWSVSTEAKYHIGSQKKVVKATNNTTNLDLKKKENAYDLRVRLDYKFA